MQSTYKIGLLLVALAATVIGVGCGGGGGDEATAAVTGQVVRADTGAGLQGATVAIGAVTATTNIDGIFELKNAPLGDRQLAVTASGFTLSTDPITVKIERGKKNQLSGSIVMVPTNRTAPPPPTGI